MYSVDELDRVVEIENLIPAPEPGSGYPTIVVRHDRLVLVYELLGLELGQKGPDGRMITPDDLPPGYAPTALVEFEGPCAHYFGPPNDEAASGHPLYSRGLRPYGTYEVLQSSWIREMEKRNRVHSRHRADRYAQRRHFVIAFHDAMFECVADGAKARRYETMHADVRAALGMASRRPDVRGD